MACGGCGSVRGMTKPEVANYIQELIDQQKLQAGINDCDGKALPKGAEVVLCNKLADIICDLIAKEKVCFPTIDEFVYDADKETLSLTFGGKEYTTHIKVKGGDVTGEGKNGIYTIYQDGKEVVKIDTGVQDVKIEDGKLKVSKSGGVEKEFDIPMPTVTPTELTDNGNGTGSVKYGDKTLSVMTKPTTATKAEDGVVTITNSNGTEVTLTIPDCPDTLLVDAFDKVELGYIHSTTCDKSALEKEPEPEKTSIYVSYQLQSTNAIDSVSNTTGEPAYAGLPVILALSDGDTAFVNGGIDAPVSIRVTSTNTFNNTDVVAFESVYEGTIPAGAKSVVAGTYKTYTNDELDAIATSKGVSSVSSIVSNSKLEVLSYEGRYALTPHDIPVEYRPIDLL